MPNAEISGGSYDSSNDGNLLDNRTVIHLLKIIQHTEHLLETTHSVVKTYGKSNSKLKKECIGIFEGKMRPYQVLAPLYEPCRLDLIMV